MYPPVQSNNSFLAIYCCLLGCDHFKSFEKKRLYVADSAAVATKIVSSKARCIHFCYHDKLGCLAINVIPTSSGIMCEMVRCLPEELEMIDHPSSTLFAKSMCSRQLLVNIIANV